jgi:antitoxin component of MazEF toxin-antitoxin module
LISHNVITKLAMSTVFEGKVRRLGNSMAVIIPKEILEESGVHEGDVLKLSIPISKQKRKEVLKKMAGLDVGSKPFERDKRDRI